MDTFVRGCPCEQQLGREEEEIGLTGKAGLQRHLNKGCGQLYRELWCRAEPSEVS